MGCGAPSKHESSADSAEAAATITVNYVAGLKKITAKYFAEGATADDRKTAVKEFADMIKDISVDNAKANDTVKAAFKSQPKFFMEYSELLTEVLTRANVKSKEYTAAKAILEENYFNQADVAGCEEALPGAFTRSFQGGAYDSKNEICEQIFKGVGTMTEAGATAEEIFERQSANLREIFYSVDRLEKKMQNFVNSVDANKQANDYKDKAFAAYEAMVKELNGIPFHDDKLQAKLMQDNAFAENYLKVIYAVVMMGETTMEEYVDIEGGLGLLLFKSQTGQGGCEANIPTGFVEVLAGEAQGDAAKICAEIFDGNDTFTDKVNEIGQMLG